MPNLPTVRLSALDGAGRLETRKEGEWRLFGGLKARETAIVNDKEVLLYEAGAELHEIYL